MLVSHLKPESLRMDYSPSSSTPALPPTPAPIYYLSELIYYSCPLWSLQPHWHFFFFFFFHTGIFTVLWIVTRSSLSLCIGCSFVWNVLLSLDSSRASSYRSFKFLLSSTFSVRCALTTLPFFKKNNYFP